MDIAGWLHRLGLGQYEPVFRDNDIDGAVLPSLTTEDLGITSVGHRRRLLEAIAAPREGDEPTRPTAVADAAPSRLVMAGDRGPRAGKAFENAVLIVRQRPGKSAWPAGKVHRHSIWSGRTTQVSMWKGAWSRTCRITSRRA